MNRRWIAVVFFIATSSFAASIVSYPDASAPPGSTTNNDDSCDIGLAPAATLLLPYFEVDLSSKHERTTIFSVTNVSPYAQIAHVTLWTDWSFPVIAFNLYLTGYDVVPVNLYDVIANGYIGQSDRSWAHNNPNLGTQPLLGTLGNPNLLPSAVDSCASVPARLTSDVLADVQSLLSRGKAIGAAISCPSESGEGEAMVGSNHGGDVAIGYATIDLVATCTSRLPNETAYYSDDILFDNVLVGDYQDLNYAGGYAGGNPMVHIRAVPEGGAANSAAVATNLPFTFYDRYTPEAARTFDRRQPLPSTFAARWVEGGDSKFDTQYKVWREGFTTGVGGEFESCDDYVENSAIPLVEVVRFDEHENSGEWCCCWFEGCFYQPTTPAASRIGNRSSLFPIVAGSTDNGGWLFFNLSNGGYVSDYSNYSYVMPYKSTRAGFGWGTGSSGRWPRHVSQNWVVVSMFSEERFGVDYDAAWLGNGCSPASPPTSAGTVGNAIGRIAPSGGTLVCAPGQKNSQLQCTGTNITP